MNTFVEVAYMDEWERIHVLEITPDGVPAARERGWMVFADFEAQMGTADVPLQSNPRRSIDDARDHGDA